MASGKNKLVLRRNLREKSQGIELASEVASTHIDQHLIKRWNKAVAVKRHVAVWLLVLLTIATGLFVQNRQLAAFYRQPVFVPGGSYSEGVLGTLSNMSPIFATGPVDTTASKLMFAGLLKIDENNVVKGDLAETYTVDDKGLVYTVTLRPDLKWHDGTPLTSEDVLYTFEAIQHPDTLSPLNQSWQSIKISVKDERTVEFQIPVALASFPQSLTTGILPAHILKDVPPSKLRSHPFNTKDPVGSGPFELVNVTTLSLDSKLINMEPFEDYHAGRPKIEQFSVRTYADEESLYDGFKLGDVQGASGITFIQQPDFGRSAVRAINIPQANGVYAFLRTTVPQLSDVKVRQALVLGTDQNAIVNDVLARTRLPLSGPLLKQQVVYGADAEQLPTNKQQALQLLDEAGWKLNEDQTREKDGQKLEFNLITQNTDEYNLVASNLQSQWAELGVTVKVSLVTDKDIQQNHIVPHNYDILLYGISLGVDPDVYAYWHSKEAGLGGFNLSEYKSAAADSGLEAGRTRSDATLRSLKYRSFLQAWRNDVPAIALYQPTFDYVQTAELSGFTPHTLISPVDRFSNVHEWMVKQQVTDQ